MDAIAILATACTLRNVINALGRTVSGLVELRGRWRDADLTVLTLESQLAALRTALTQIKEWTEASQSADLHYQLVMDLDRCIACCRLLISKIDADVLQFQTIADRLDMASKFKLLLKTRDFKKTQSMIGQQTTALTLLLTVCNSAAISQQKELLERPQNRRVFKAVEDDTSSLFVHREVDSLLSSSSSSSSTPTSISPSKRGLKFEFDKQLFMSKIYERWIRGSPKKSPWEQQPRQRITAVETTEKFSVDPVETKDKFIIDGTTDVVETREKFSVETIETREKFSVESAMDMIETRDKFIIDIGTTEKFSADGNMPGTVETREKFSADGTFEDDHELRTVSSSSTLVPQRTGSSSIKDRWKPLRLIPPARKSDSLKRSLAIDNAIKEESRRVQRDHKALLIGSESRLNILTAATTDRKVHTSQELDDYKSKILKNVREYTYALVKEIRRVQVDPDAKYLWAYVNLIEGYHDNCLGLDGKFFDALESILQNSLISDLVKWSRQEDLLPRSAEYFFTEISRISSPDYVPNELDIYYAATTSTGLYKAEVRADEISVDLLDIGGLSGKRKKWIHHFEDARFIIFVADLDQCEQEDKIAETMRLLDGIANSRWFTRSSIILLLNIADPTPGYSDNGSDVRRAAEYVLRRFEELNLDRLFVSPCKTANGGAAIQLMLSTMKEAILTEALQDGKILL